MRSIVIALALFISPICWSTPITYVFSGYTTSIMVNNEEYDPSIPITRTDGTFVTNGHYEIEGELVFDPIAWRDGAGGSGQGQVFSWSCNTQGLTYFGAGGGFHYLTFEENSFSYLDEIPQGGYGPDVAGIKLDFDNGPFTGGPAHFPIENFIGGYFSTAVEDGKIDDELSMQGLQGVITHLQAKVVAVPLPSSLALFAGSLVLFCGVQRQASRRKRVA